MEFLPKEKSIEIPKEGWKEHTYYLVEVSYAQCNPVHQAILGIGFTSPLHNSKGQPGNYSSIMNFGYDYPIDIGDCLDRKVYYLKIVKELCTLGKE